MATKLFPKATLLSLFLIISNVIFGQTIPPAPNGLRVTATECGKISLAWDDYGVGLEETRYSIYKSDSENGYYSYIGTVDNNILTFSDRGLSSNFNPNQNYYYKITAYFQNLETPFSTPISSSFNCPTPTGLTVNSTNCGNIELHWNDFGNLANETGYNIYRSQGSDIGFGYYIGQVGANTVDFVDNSNKQSGVIYNYRIAGSFNNSYYTESPKSLPASLTYNCNAPANFRITNSTCGKIELTWDDYQGNLSEITYQIYRSDNSTNNFNLIKTVDANVLSYTDTSYLSNNIPFSYQIKATFSNNISSNLSSTLISNFTCPTPTNLQFVGSDCGNINLTWDDVTGETGYVIFVYDNKYPDNKREIGSVGPNITTFSAKGHNFGEDFYSKAGSIHKYVVSGKYYQTITSESNVASGSFICPLPSNPSIISANCAGITISWEDFPSILNESGYAIYASNAPNGYYTRIGTVNANILTFSFSNYIESGITYYFKIAGLFNNNITDLSNSTSAKITCEIPTGLSVSNISCNKLTLSWLATPNATGYAIHRAENIFEGEYQLYTQIDGSNLSIDMPIQQGKKYFYKLKAVFGTNKSSLSNFVGPFAADCSNFPIPNGLRIVSKQCGSITLTWDDIPQPFNETNFVLTRYRPTEDGFSNYEHSTITLDPNTFTYTDTRSYNNNYQYFYKISGVYNDVFRESDAISVKMECVATSQLTITNGINCNGINLQWTDFGPNFVEQSYEIYRADNSENAALGYFNKIKELPAGVLSYVDNNPDNYDLPFENNLLFYKIIAKSPNIKIESNVASGKYNCNSNITLTSTNDCYKIRLNWVDNEPSVENNGFIIYVESNENSGKFYEWFKVSSNIYSYEINDYIRANQNYTFKVAKIIGGITSNMSNSTNQIITCFNQPILSIESIDCGRISLNINTNSNGELPTDFQVFRSGNGINGYFQLIGRGSGVPNIYHDISSYESPISYYFTNIMEENHQYFYKVILFYGGVEVGHNTYISSSFTCLDKAAVTGLHIEAITCNTIKLAWNSAELQGKNRFQYYVYKSTTGINGEYKYANGWSDYISAPNFYDSNNLISGQSVFYKIQYLVDGIFSIETAPFEVNFNPYNLSSIKSGLWHDPATWSCGRVPSSLDEILINNGHVISISDNVIGNCKNIENNGNLVFGVGSEIKLNTL